MTFLVVSAFLPYPLFPGPFPGDRLSSVLVNSAATKVFTFSLGCHPLWRHCNQPITVSQSMRRCVNVQQMTLHCKNFTFCLKDFCDFKAARFDNDNVRKVPKSRICACISGITRDTGADRHVWHHHGGDTRIKLIFVAEFRKKKYGWHHQFPPRVTPTLVSPLPCVKLYEL